MVRENCLNVSDLILPIFIIEGKNKRQKIPKMPGVERHSVDSAVKLAKQAQDLGIPAVAPFPCPPTNIRDNEGSNVTDPNNLICRFVRATKDKGLSVGVITDPALDPFTSHGHDGIMRRGVVVNDVSVEQIVRGAIEQAKAGADIIAPSDMMDGRIGAIRQELDNNGFNEVGILSYAAKYASAFYGPYRTAIKTDKTLKGTKDTYYIDHANSMEALREAELDINEGADMIMVKPGMPYLDVIKIFKDTFGLPTFAYQVSGEYSMIEFASKNGAIDGERAMMESLIAMKRAGADGIFSYYAIKAANFLGC